MLGMNNKNNSTDPGSVNLIGGGTKIIGDINSIGDIRIDGHLTGNVSTNGKFVLGQNGVVDGNINSSNADISGEVKGKVNVVETLSLKRSARVNGDIVTGKLVIESGALFNGNCNMGAKVKNMLQPSEGMNASKTA
jgi:cytoskeletal protein CcmA (bactofilin family)